MGLRKPGQIRKVGGTLANVSEETAQQLGQEVGLPAVTSPMQGAAVGASPDQAKMLGSQMNLRTAIRARTQTDTLDRTQRTQQYERDVTAEEQQATAKLDEYLRGVPGLSKLDEEMAKKVAELLKPGGAATDQIVRVDWDAIQAAFGDNLDLINALRPVAADEFDPNTGMVSKKSILTRALNGEPLSSEEENQLTTQLEKSGLDLNELRNYVLSPSDILAFQIAESRPQDIRIGQLDSSTLTKLGLDDDYLESIFGADYKNVTYADVKQRVESLQSVFADVKELKRISADPFASPTMRREANKRLRELGHMGRRSQQEKVNDLEAQIEDGDVIAIGDATFEIEEILEDDDWEEALSYALKDEKAMERLEETQPELAQWLKTNKEALDKKFSEATGRLAEGQDIMSSLLLSDEDIAEIEAEFGTYNPEEARAIQKELFGDVSYDALSPAQKAQLNENITDRAEGNFEGILHTDMDTAWLSDQMSGINLASLSPEERTKKAAEINEAWENYEFGRSGYATSAEEVRRIYTDAGIEVPKDVEALLNLSAQEWFTQRPDMNDLLNKATGAAEAKATGEANTAALQPYEKYGSQFLEWLVGGDAQKLEKVRNGNLSLDLGNRMDLAMSWLDLGKTDAERQILVTAMLNLEDQGSGGIKYIQRADSLKTLLNSSLRANVLQTLSKTPVQLFAQLDTLQTQNKNHDNALKAKTPAEAWKAAFAQDPVAGNALASLYENYADKKLMEEVIVGGTWVTEYVGFTRKSVWKPTIRKMSIWPKSLDSNGDGILDNHKDVIKSMQQNLQNTMNTGTFIRSDGTIIEDAVTGLTGFSTAESLLNRAHEAMASTEVQNTWNADGFSTNYTRLLKANLSGKEIAEALGVPELTPKAFANLSETRRTEIANAITTINSRLDTWNKNIYSRIPLMGTPAAQAYKTAFGDIPSRSNYLLKGEGYTEEVFTRMDQFKATSKAFPNWTGQTLEVPANIKHHSNSIFTSKTVSFSPQDITRVLSKYGTWDKIKEVLQNPPAASREDKMVVWNGEKMEWKEVPAPEPFVGGFNVGGGHGGVSGGGFGG